MHIGWGRPAWANIDEKISHAVATQHVQMRAYRCNFGRLGRACPKITFSDLCRQPRRKLCRNWAFFDRVSDKVFDKDLETKFLGQALGRAALSSARRS